MQRLRHQRQIHELKSEIELYTTLRDQSISGLLELAKDSNNLERIAREKYGMHLPNEEVFIIKEWRRYNKPFIFSEAYS